MSSTNNTTPETSIPLVVRILQKASISPEKRIFYYKLHIKLFTFAGWMWILGIIVGVVCALVFLGIWVKSIASGKGSFLDALVFLVPLLIITGSIYGLRISRSVSEYLRREIE